MATATDVRAALRARILETSYPCLGARAAVRQGTCSVGVYDELGGSAEAEALWRDLVAFGDRVRRRSTPFVTYVAAFRRPQRCSETKFEALLWRQLQQLHDVDALHHTWDVRVSSDPADPRFSFSVAGIAYFVVGMHPDSSREARRFELPALCFNAHEQFEDLREANRYQRFRDRIRERDIAWQGSVNPMVHDHGEASEAAQYSGRATGPGWRCPLHVRDSARVP
jgi:FPC/CPF motif-containing protein YcgG